MEILESFPVSVDVQEVKTRLRIKDPTLAEELLQIARPLIAARAVYRVSFVDEKREDEVIIDRVRFRSQVLRKNLDAVGRVFPYVITIGTFLEERTDATGEMLEKYDLDVIANLALNKARLYVRDRLCVQFGLEGLSYMSPGSLADWPIEEQKPLFSLLNGVESAIGVKLTESLLMIPRKSLSGIFFPTEVTFTNCQLCPREQCEGRKAPYDQDLAKAYGILK